MEPTVVTPNAIEDSTYVVTADFTDEDGAAVIPNAITWSLEDPDGNAVNGRTDVAIGVPAASVDVVLEGDDLDPGAWDPARLLMTFEADYDSSLGSGLPLIGQLYVVVVPLKP
jgi:hypothetical protein